MDMSFSAEDLAFRDEIRAFINANFPDAVRMNPSEADIKRWHHATYEKGWAAVNWPVEYGGTGWTATRKYFWDRETANAGCPAPSPFGISMLAPILIAYGDDVQREEHLPRILSGERRWCQGYSEPGSGSDLASLRTRAVREGDYYTVNGAKTWISDAHNADWIFALVRTDSTGKKQQGITFLLIDMTTPGISVSPIITMGGSHVVNSVTFEDVKVPTANRIGEENKGWTYAKELLTHERTGLAGVARSKAAFAKLKKISTEQVYEGVSLLADADFRTKLADIEIQLMALEMTELRTLATVATGHAPGPESSILKIKGTEIQQRLTELAIEATAYYAIPFPALTDGLNEPPVGPDYARETSMSYMSQRVATIYGGSSEIQRNVIAKAVLGL
ncbi:MAG: acyl-CoA dehydrogenase family protein [Gammaproteobacteria bacterium]|nr:acyl-CoA dehydrogenase family protein [Gammaproteobacteria bacterium]